MLTCVIFAMLHLYCQLFAFNLLCYLLSHAFMTMFLIDHGGMYLEIILIIIVVPVRLSDGNDEISGRVEVYFNGQWGTICDDSWTTGSSAVVCRQLGLGATGTINRYGAGPAGSPIYLDNVSCRGSEVNMLACPHLPLGVHNCDHVEDVGVTCSGLYG